MLVTHPFRRFIERIFRIKPLKRTRTRRRPVRAWQLPAEVQLVEARVLLSGVLTDTTPVKTLGAVEGNSTGSVTLATFNDSIPPSGFTTLAATGAVSTSVSGISGANVAGDFKNSSGVFQGYIYNGSTFSTISISGASFTHVAGITGNVAFGTYTNSSGQQVGFTFNGAILTSLVAPGAVSTTVRGVSGSTIIGTYQDSSGNTRGFSFNGSSYTLLDAPGATSTTFTGISGSTIAGFSLDGSGTHAFVLNGSTFTALTPPGAVTSQALAISGSNIVGSYIDASAKTHGFLFNGSTFTALDVAGATSTAATGVSGSIVVGNYKDGSGVAHAFSYNGSTFTSLDVPAGTATAAVGVSGAAVVGTFTDGSGNTQGYENETPPTAGGFNANVNWGGTITGTPTVSVVLVSQTATGSSWQVVGSATYSTQGTFNVTVDVNDANGNSLHSTNTSFKVSPLADTTAACALTATAGTTTGNVVLATFTDANASAVASDFTVGVNWGGTLNGAPTQSVALVSRTGTSSTWEVVGSAVYAAAGNDTVTVSVADTSSNSFNSAKTTFNVTTATTPSFTFSGNYSVVTSSTSTPVLATITQTGDQLTLNGSTTGNATVIVSPGQVVAGGAVNYLPQLVTSGAVVATWWNSSISFTSGPFAGQTWTKLDLATNYTNQGGASAHVIQNGTSVTFVNKLGGTSAAHWTSPTQLFITDWNESVTVVPGQLVFQDGSIWSENLTVTGANNGSGTTTIAASPSQVYVFDYVDQLGHAVHLVQTGMTGVIVINASAQMSTGAFISATQFATSASPSDIATISNDLSTITWTDGSVWTRTASTSAVTVTNYTNQNGVGVHLIQNGTAHVGFVDGVGQTSLGTMSSSTTAVSDLYGPNDVATIAANLVTWQDGSRWTQTAVVPPTITFTDANGAQTQVRLTSPTTLAGLDLEMAGLTATRQNGQLVWSNGVVWNNFDFNALNALFEMNVSQFSLSAGQYAVTTGSGSPTMASITANGTSLTLNGTSATATATIVNSSQILVNGTDTATYGNGSIVFTSGIFAGQTWTKLTLPANNYTNQSGATVQVLENGTTMSFVNKFGASTPAVFINPTTLFLSAWNENVTIGTGTLTFQDGSIWSMNTVLSGTNNGRGTATISAAPSTVYDFDYVNQNNAAVHVIQTGTNNVVFIFANGVMSVGTFISPTQLQTPATPNDVATISNDFTTVSWQDGTFWTETAKTSAITVTDYTNQNGVGVHLVQNGSNNVAFIDSLGRSTVGHFISAGQVVTDLYGPNDVATISANASTVTWQDGSVWTQTNNVPMTITFNDTNGAFTHVRLTSPTTLIGLDGEMNGLTATRQNGQIVWSNGVVWNEFDFDQLNALFEMGTGYP